MKQKIIGIIRERNEGIVLIRCLEHALFLCDHIIIYDDNSRQEDLKLLKEFIAKTNKKAKDYFREDIYEPVITLFENKNWQKNREREETKHRQFLLNKARELYKDDERWIYCFDADEVIESPSMVKLKVMTLGKTKLHTAYSFKLFDAFATEEDNKDYIDEPLYNFRKYFDFNCRDIIMLWLDCEKINFVGLDRREPNIPMNEVMSIGFCQHYSRSLNRDKFNKKCDYYANHFPKYSKKWRERKGKFIMGGYDKNFKVGIWQNVKTCFKIAFK